SHLDLQSLTVTGKTLGENILSSKIYNDDVIRGTDNPVLASGGLAILRGNLAPSGAVIKPAAAEPALWKHAGRAIVFDSYDELNARIDDPALDVDANSVLVLRNAGPKGAPGMPEWGNLPIPQKLLKAGVRDMVRISDARMSGTSYGACVLHVAPESFVGGPLALLKEGDVVELAVTPRQRNMRVSEEELARRRAAWRPKDGIYPRGYGKLFLEHIKQADEGCDFDFLEGTAPIPEPEIHSVESSLSPSVRIYRVERDDLFFAGAGGDAGCAGCATDGVAARVVFTAGEILSAFANKTLTCQSCVSFRDALKPGMPVRRMPFLAFQNVSRAGSSVTPVPWKSSGG